jgi:hypothetical protein
LKKPIVLRIYKGEQLVGVKQFIEQQVVIGRQGEVQVALDNESVSFIHAAIEERDSGYYVCDLGSETGTFKNGDKVLDAKIESGDIIQLGDYRVEFYVGAPRPKAAPESSASPAMPSLAVMEPVVVQAPRIEESASVSEPNFPEPPPMVPEPPAEIVVAPSYSAPVTAKPSPPAGRTRARRPVEGYKKHKKGKTFAPPSRFANVKDFVKPTKGTVVEVLVAWRERVIATYHYAHKGTITMGVHPDNDIVLPVMVSRARKIPVVKIDLRATVLVAPEMTGELVRGQGGASFAELLRQNRLNKDGAMYAIVLEQGEMVRLDLGDQLSIIVRYVSDSPKPLIAPLLDLSASETTGVVLSIALVLMLGVYMYLYTPPKALPGDGADEPLRLATLTLQQPTPAPTPEMQKPTAPAPTPAATPPPPVVRATPSPTKTETKQASKPAGATNLTTKNDPGKSANAAPNRNKNGPREVTSPKQGGAVKTTDTAGSQFQSPKKDVSKMGAFSTFGAGGAQNRIDTATSGAGGLAGDADQATGKAGYAENRPGEGLGFKMKDTGRGGTGTANIGIEGGIGTQGRGSGNSGYGTGGLGDRAGVKISAGGTGESFSGTIDREAIRRVILANYKVIKTCYERQLNRNPNLFGKLVLSWVIGAEGRVMSVGVKSNELGSKDVAECILDRLRTWRFPEPPTNQEVEVEAYPFFFSN